MAESGHEAIYVTGDGVAEVVEGTPVERAISHLVKARQARLDRRPGDARLQLVSEDREQSRKRFLWFVMAPSVGILLGFFVLIGTAFVLEGLQDRDGMDWGAFWIVMGACFLGVLLFGAPLAIHLVHDYRRRVRDHDGHVLDIVADEQGLTVSVDGRRELAGPWSGITLTAVHGHLYDQGRNRVWRIEQLDLADGEGSTLALRAHAFRKSDRLLGHILLFLILNGRLRRVHRQ